MRSLFLFDMTFWLYLAALGLYVAYLFAKRPAMQMVPAGHPIEDLEERDGAWATQLGQVATLVTVFGWVLNTLALTTRAFERMEHSGTFAPWSNQFEAMAYVSWAIILGYVLLEFRYRIKAVGAFVVGIGFIAMGAASLLPLSIPDGRAARSGPEQLLDLHPCLRHVDQLRGVCHGRWIGPDVSLQRTGGQSWQSVAVLCRLSRS